jgi:hypothetical protein
MRRLVLRTSLISRILIVGLCCVLVPHAVVQACSPVPPTPWFTEHLTPGKVALPPGVSLGPTDSQTIVVLNSSSTPLYVIGELYTANKEYEKLAVAFPSNTGPLHKLMDGQVFTWRSVTVDPDQPPVLAWDNEPSTTDRLKITVWFEDVSAGRGRVARVQRRNQTGNNRPSNVAVPPPQQTELTLVYGDQQLTVPLTISYVLNQAYDPNSVREGTSGCNNGSLFLWVGLVGLGGAAMVVALVMGMRREQPL